MIEIYHICSLGTHCQSTQISKGLALKKESYPFDWVFSSPANIIDIIEDNFSDFLNKDLYIGINNKRCSHTKYGSNMFNHHNPKEIDPHFSYFVRCVERFRKLLEKESNKLFIIMFPNINNDLIETTKNQITELNHYIKQKTSNHFMFAVCHIPNQEEFKADTLDIDNLKIVLLHTKSVSNGLYLVDREENEMLQKLLAESYSFHIL
jgi:hypothetical protein